MLFSAMFGVQVVKVVKASSPISSGIRIISPTNITYSPSLLALKALTSGLGARNIYYSMVYRLDGKDNVTMPIVKQTHEMSFQITIIGSATVPELSEGSHSITVYQKIEVNTSAPSTLWDSTTVYFTVDDGIPPIITNLSLENNTYSQNELPLNFTKDEPCSWIGYCLDGQDNVTVAGNTTLTDLANSEHNVTIYAQDLAGNIGASETINFSISQPETSLDSFPTTIITIGFGAVFVIVGLLVYFKKRKL
jgi:hypothetical protein